MEKKIDGMDNPSEQTLRAHKCLLDTFCFCFIHYAYAALWAMTRLFDTYSVEQLNYFPEQLENLLGVTVKMENPNPIVRAT